MGIRTSDLCMQPSVDEKAHEKETPDYSQFSEIPVQRKRVPKQVNGDKMDRVTKICGI